MRFCQIIEAALQELLCASCVDQGNYVGKASQQWIPDQLPCTEGGTCLLQVQDGTSHRVSMPGPQCSARALGSLLNLQNLTPDTVFHSRRVKHPENLFPAQSWASTNPPHPRQELCLLALQGIFNEYQKQTVNDGFCWRCC